MILFCLESNRLHDTPAPNSCWLDFNVGNYSPLPAFQLGVCGAVSLLAPQESCMGKKRLWRPLQGPAAFSGLRSNVPLLNGIIPVRSVHR